MSDLRETIIEVMEWYELAATPTPSSMYRQTVDESEPTEGSTPAVTDSRRALRDMSIDLKYIITETIKDIEARHGERRVERLMTWIHNGYLNRQDKSHREQVKEDRKRIRQAIAIRYYGREP